MGVFSVPRMKQTTGSSFSASRASSEVAIECVFSQTKHGASCGGSSGPLVLQRGASSSSLSASSAVAGRLPSAVAGRLVARLPGSPAAGPVARYVTASPCQSYLNVSEGGGGWSSPTGGWTISQVTLKDMAALPDGVPRARGHGCGAAARLALQPLASCGLLPRREEARCDTLGRSTSRVLVAKVAPWPLRDVLA